LGGVAAIARNGGGRKSVAPVGTCGRFTPDALRGGSQLTAIGESEPVQFSSRDLTNQYDKLLDQHKRHQSLQESGSRMRLTVCRKKGAEA
jgi:hypothetical protein